MRYNLSLLAANLLFALNFSLFVSIVKGDVLSLGAVYMVEIALFAIISIILYITRSGKRVAAKEIITISTMGIISALGWSYASLWGMSLTSPIDAATIASVGPSLTLILAHILGRRRLTPLRLTGIAVSLVGVLILTLSQGITAQVGQALQGNLILVAAMTIAAINTLVVKPSLERYGVIPVALYFSVPAALVSLPLFWHNVAHIDLANINIGHTAEAITLLLLGGTLPLMLLLEGTEHLSPLHTSLYRYVQPLVTSIVVVARGQAVLSLNNYIALAALIIGALLMAKGVDRAG